MKKVLVASILGIALSAASSYGQGYVIMQNYDLVGSTPVFSAVEYYSGSTVEYVGADSGTQVELYYSLTGTAGSYVLASGSLTSLYPGSKTGGSPTTDGAGTFFGPTVTIPGYTSGDCFLYVQAVGPNIVQSDSPVFEIPLNSNPALPSPDLLNLSGNETTSQGLQPIIIDPEPSTFALGGVAAALVIFRRRKRVGFLDKKNLDLRHS